MGADHGLVISLVAAAIIYALTGGADYGAGVWDLLARGPRASAQRALIERSIAPIWEANHVWLIFIVTVLFGAFPPAYAAVSIALHIPMTLLLLGIVARGTAFVFRAYDRPDDRVQRRWGLVFSIASIVSPVFLGMLVGSLASGEIHFEGGVLQGGYFHPWATTIFPLVIGLLALALFAYLAAIYLAYAADDAELASDFRARALVSGAVAAGLAVLALVVARTQASSVYRALMGEVSQPVWWSGPGPSLLRALPAIVFGATALAALVAAFALVRRRYGLARIAGAAQLALIVFGWSAAQTPYLLADEMTYLEASAPAHVQRVIFGVVLVGGPFLAAALFYLFRVFRRVPA